MKKTLLSLFVLSLFLLTATHTKAAYTKAITVDPILLLQWNDLRFRYETSLSSKNSLALDLELDNRYNDVVGFRVGALYRWYFRDVFPVHTAGLEGFNLGPYALLGFYSWDYPVSNERRERRTNVHLELGGELAYKWVFGGFTIEPNFRLGFPVVKKGYYTNFYYGFGVGLGYAW